MTDEIFFLTSLITLVGAFILVSLILWAIPVRLWVEAISAGAKVGILYLVGMRLRKVNPPAVVRPLIWATKAGIPLDIEDLEAHYLAGGAVGRVVHALISADKANIELSFQQAAAIDLAGRDVFEAVQVSVTPKVITTPRITAMARDGIQLIATARVTVRVNINRLVGGAGEETVMARVGEGIVSNIGSADSHKAVLENPNKISKTVLARGLDAGTAFEILSIDIADIDVGKEHRCRAADRSGRGRQAGRPGARRGAACDGRRAGAGEPRQGAGEAGRSGRGRGRGSAGDRRGLPGREPRGDELNALRRHPVRYLIAAWAWTPSSAGVSMSDVPERLDAALQGRYRIERQLGEGGMVTVYLADDLKHERV